MNYNLDGKVIFQLFYAATNISLAHNVMSTMLYFNCYQEYQFTLLDCSHGLNFPTIVISIYQCTLLSRAKIEQDHNLQSAWENHFPTFLCYYQHWEKLLI